MLEYVKLILDKVSFDSKLFEKELRKSMRMLVRNELETLRDWCYNRFSGTYCSILDRVFGKVMAA
ncbi:MULTISPECIES: hypothetical protein [Rufibacter]|uniref:Uncharacterized protein n=1 Tax=Rufibacter quisquiliarum TaxID=1549639 RepID=A0A839G9F1_9BACT|nr:MULTISPECIES: hypothetical protein [Rufibacter]MBA9075602.1 hypothetical protein [Rufibacter quisquiliarum]